MDCNAPPSTQVSIKRLQSLESIKAEDWNRLISANNPFLSHEFLFGLEKYKCLEPHGWLPCHLVAYADTELVGALPLYIKTNSYGEFVFDWAWADAYERAGGNYYPKLVSAIPFTPVRGPRLLIDANYAYPDTIKTLLIDEVIDFATTAGLSSFHCLFPLQDDVDIFLKRNLLLRKTCQFHWHNPGYRDFDDFLDTLTSKKRKKIKRERRQISESGINIEVLTGKQINEQQWRAFYEFYCSTFYRRWGSPRLSYEFFLSLGETLPEQTLLVLARKDQSWVAGAFAMQGDNTLFGRHWGCNAQYPFLHFELCYYQTIEYCIRHGLQTLDAGVQGEHKLSRGFRPVETLSCHWIRQPGFRQAIEDFLARETAGLDAYIDDLSLHLPYKSNEQ